MKPIEMNDLRIKRVEFNEMPKVAEIIRSSASWYEPFVAEKDMKEHEVDRRWMIENYQKRDFYLGENQKSEEVGTISLQYFGKTTYLGYIYLDTDFVGNGHGKTLMDFAKVKSQSVGQESMILIAHPEAKWATKAYLKYGFKLKHKSKKKILEYDDGRLKPYYEEGFHLYEYNLS